MRLSSEATASTTPPGASSPIHSRVKTVVLFFEKGAPTRIVLDEFGNGVPGIPVEWKIWYYQLDPGRNLGKTNPLNDDDLREFVEMQEASAESEQSWSVDMEDVDRATFDLSARNPNAPEEAPLRDPQEILDEIEALDEETAEILAGIRELV